MLSVLRQLFGSLRSFKKETYLTILFIILEAVINAMIPFVTAQLINSLQQGQVQMQAVGKTGILLFFMALLSLAFGGIAGYTSAKASSGLARNLRSDIFQNIQTFSFANIDKFSTPSMISRLTTDIGNVMFAFMTLIRTAFRAPLVILFSFFMAWRLAGSLSFSFLLIIPFLALAFGLMFKFAMPYFHAAFRQFDEINATVGENVQAAREVKAYARADYEKRKFKKASGRLMRIFIKADRIVELSSPAMQLAINFNMLFIFALGSELAVKSGGLRLNVGQMSAMLTYGVQIMIQLMMLSTILVAITMSAESARRIKELLDERSSLTSPPDALQMVADGSVVFDHVSFRYSKEAETDALSDIHFTIPSGGTVGILGGTGSGKSTLIQLIPRLYDVTKGRLLVGGEEVQRYDLSALRDQVAIVLQKNVLFSGTIAENLRWGNPEASQEELEWAARIAQADDFIRAFPKGYDSLIEQGGTNVSGGQKQRLCIARSLLKKPKILIFDDSTSAVDTKTEAKIRIGLREALPEATKIIISQRISSVKDCDQIILLKGGTVDAIGRHEHLLQSHADYRDTYERQRGGQIGE